MGFKDSPFKVLDSGHRTIHDHEKLGVQVGMRHMFSFLSSGYLDFVIP